MRETNFWSYCTNRAAVSITTTLYDRRALDCTSDRPLINSLNHLAYLASTSARVRETLCVDGGLERLVCILKECLMPRKPFGTDENSIVAWKWSLALQCLLFLGTRGSERIRWRLVEAGAIPVVCTILDSFLRRAAFPDEQKQQQLPELWLSEPNINAPATSSDAQLPKPMIEGGALVPRDEDVVWALEILAFVSKYSYLKPHLQSTHLLPTADLMPSQDDRMTTECEYDSYDFSSSSDLALEYQMEKINIFPLVEKFTARKDAREVPYWAGIIMRNSCRKDETKGGIRQCANFECGKWEEYPRHFAKCRRCKRTKYCSKTCQLTAWSFHRYWCAPATTSASSNGTQTLSVGERPQSAGSATERL